MSIPATRREPTIARHVLYKQGLHLSAICDAMNMNCFASCQILSAQAYDLSQGGSLVGHDS